MCIGLRSHNLPFRKSNPVFIEYIHRAGGSVTAAAAAEYGHGAALLQPGRGNSGTLPGPVVWRRLRPLDSVAVALAGALDHPSYSMYIVYDREWDLAFGGAFGLWAPLPLPWLVRHTIYKPTYRTSACGLARLLATGHRQRLEHS